MTTDYRTGIYFPVFGVLPHINCIAGGFVVWSHHLFSYIWPALLFPFIRRPTAATSRLQIRFYLLD